MNPQETAVLASEKSRNDENKPKPTPSRNPAQSELRLWTSVDHDSHWPVGCASIVLAPTEDEARRLLDRGLEASGLKPSAAYPYTLKEMPIRDTVPWALILCDGEY